MSEHSTYSVRMSKPMSVTADTRYNLALAGITHSVHYVPHSYRREAMCCNAEKGLMMAIKELEGEEYQNLKMLVNNPHWEFGYGKYRLYREDGTEVTLFGRLV